MIADLLRRLFDCPEPADLGYRLSHSFTSDAMRTPLPRPPEPPSGIDRELAAADLTPPRSAC